MLFFFGAGGDDEVLGKVVEVGVEAEATGGKGWKGELVADDGTKLGVNGKSSIPLIWQQSLQMQVASPTPHPPEK